MIQEVAMNIKKLLLPEAEYLEVRLLFSVHTADLM